MQNARICTYHIEEQEYYQEQVRGYLTEGAPSAWFDGSYAVVCERDILLPDAGMARPDRVMLRGDEAVVVDYKFGRKEEKAYRRQVGFYCKLLRQMGYRRVEGHIWYVTLGKIETVTAGRE